jgi:hypothetical protein
MAKYYESDITKMMRDLLREKPQIVEEQRKGRALWWDRPQDLDTQRRADEASVRQQPYVYQTKT